MSNTKYVLRTVVLALASTVLVFLLVGLLLADRWQVRTTRTIAAPVERLQPLLVNLRLWPQWSVIDFELGNPTTREFQGEPAQANQSATWRGPQGIATVIWSYPRGEAITKDGETAIDVAAYSAHIAALLGAHIIKIKLSTDHLMLPEAKKAYEDNAISIASQAERVRHAMQASFNGRRIVVFSGGAKKGEDSIYDDARAIRDGGGNGSIIGRNAFQRSRHEALAMLGKLVDIYKGKA